MNRMVIIPMGILIMLAVVNVLSHSGTAAGQVDFNGPTGQITVDGVDSVAVYEGQDSKYLGIFSQNDMLAMLILAIGVVFALGFSGLGSGFSTLSQELVFKSMIYGGIWGILSISAWEFFNDDTIAGAGMIIWSIMTLSYVFGFVSEVGSGD